MSAAMFDRRRMLGTLVALALAGPLHAQDPRASLAQQAARSWLEIADKGDAAASWRAASPLFRNVIDEARWTEALPQARSPLGPVVSRTLAASQYATELPGLPKGGDYVLLAFRTEFARQPRGTERVTVVRDEDGVWRVAGYVIL